MTWSPKSSLTVETSHWTWILCLSTLPPDSGTLISKWNAKFTFFWKEDFGPLSNSSFFSLAQVICLSSLLVKLSQVFESALLDSILKLAIIPVACAHFPTQFLPVNFAFNMLWYSTPWTATPFSNDPVTYPLCGGCQWSSSGLMPSQQCSPLLWFQRTRDTQNVYCMVGHFWKRKCKYSNIFRYWFLTFISCKL